MPSQAQMPCPAAPEQLIPQRISASGYNSLVACPYQYYSRHMLGLNEMDEVREGVEKRDYGSWVHDILHRFHQRHPVLTEHHPSELESALQQITQEVFKSSIAHDYLVRAWLLRWQQAIPAYLEAQLQSEAEGWHYNDSEVAFEFPVDSSLELRGRVDRVDVQQDGMMRVLDYKMTDVTRLRGKLKLPGEDVQLACYARVYEAEEAAFISIEKDKVANVMPPHEITQLAEANLARLQQLFRQLRDSAAMPANGIDSTCSYCEMRGLCRKSGWANE